MIAWVYGWFFLVFITLGSANASPTPVVSPEMVPVPSDGALGDFDVSDHSRKVELPECEVIRTFRMLPGKKHMELQMLTVFPKERLGEDGFSVFVRVASPVLENDELFPSHVMHGAGASIRHLVTSQFERKTDRKEFNAYLFENISSEGGYAPMVGMSLCLDRATLERWVEKGERIDIHFEERMKPKPAYAKRARIDKDGRIPFKSTTITFHPKELIEEFIRLEKTWIYRDVR